MSFVVDIIRELAMVDSPMCVVGRKHVCRFSNQTRGDYFTPDPTYVSENRSFIYTMVKHDVVTNVIPSISTLTVSTLINIYRMMAVYSLCKIRD